MAISNPSPQSNEVVWIQRSDGNGSYREIHVSGSDIIIYIGPDGNVNADIISDFYSAYPPPGSTGLGTGSTYPFTSSWATNAVNAPAGAGLGTGSTYPFTSSWAESASWSPSAAGLGTGSTYPFTSSWSEQSLTASYINQSAFGNVTIFPLEYKFDTSTAASDPGSSKFRFNNATPASITNIYVNDTTNGGLDASKIIDRFRSGSTQLYIQQKDDASNAFLFTVKGASTDNSGWFTIPVDYDTSVGVVPSNNKACAFVVVNRLFIDSGSLYPITASWAISSSYAYTASYGLEFTASDLRTNIISASQITASQMIYSMGTGDNYFAGNITGSSITASRGFFGTASWADNAVSATSASYASSSTSASYALSASWAPGGSGTSLGTGSTYPFTASWATNAINATSASYALSASWAPSTPSQFATSASWASESLTLTLPTTMSTPRQHCIAVGSDGLQGGTIGYSDAIMWFDSSSAAIGGYLSTYNNEGDMSGIIKIIGDGGTVPVGLIEFYDSASPSFPVVSIESDAADHLHGKVFLKIYSGSISEFRYIIASNIHGDVGIGEVDPQAKLHVMGHISSSAITSSLYGTSSWAIDVVNGAAPDYTSSLYGTASWATNAINSLSATSASYASASTSASYAPVEPAYSASAAAYINTKQATLTTGGTYTITASWATSSVSSSYSPVEPAYSSSAAAYINTKQATLTTGGNYTITASWADNAISSSYALSASYSPGGSPATYTSSLYGTASWADNAISSSYALSASWAPSVASDIAISASFASSSISSSYVPMGKSIVLCAAYTPTATGADAAEVTIPYSPLDGMTAVTWSVTRLSLRTKTAETSTSSIDIEKSVLAGEFSPSSIGSVTLYSSSYESGSVGSLGSIASGNKIRFNVATLGAATYWTVITEISNV